MKTLFRFVGLLVALVIIAVLFVLGLGTVAGNAFNEIHFNATPYFVGMFAVSMIARSIFKKH